MAATPKILRKASKKLKLDKNTVKELNKVGRISKKGKELGGLNPGFNHTMRGGFNMKKSKTRAHRNVMKKK